MKEYDIQSEKSRTYTVKLPSVGVVYEKTIVDPITLFFESGHSFHRIWDGTKMVLMPAPGLIKLGGFYGFVEVSWIPTDVDNPCAF